MRKNFIGDMGGGVLYFRNFEVREREPGVQGRCGLISLNSSIDLAEVLLDDLELSLEYWASCRPPHVAASSFCGGFGRNFL